MRWRRERTVWPPAEPDPHHDLSSEQRGNVTDSHRDLLGRLVPGSVAAWSARARWACLEQLRVSTVTAAAEARVEQAWVDGPSAFCVVYRPPYGPDARIGLRRAMRDSELGEYHLGDLSPGYYDLGHGPVPDPVMFGRTVADFDIGEPLGNVLTILRTDGDGVGWWGTLDGDLPSPARP